MGTTDSASPGSISVWKLCQGGANIGSDVDVAIKASAGNWTALAAKWEQDLTDQLRVTVNIRTLANPRICEFCDEFNVPLKR
jgi:hypothetical protein